MSLRFCHLILSKCLHHLKVETKITILGTYNLGQKVLRICKVFTGRPRRGFRITAHSHPTPPHHGQSCLVERKNVSTGLQHCVFWGRGKEYMINMALKSCIPRLDIQRAFFLTFLSKINCSTRNFEVSGGIRLSWTLVFK